MKNVLSQNTTVFNEETGKYKGRAVVGPRNTLFPNQYEGGAATNGSVPWRLDVLVRCPTDSCAWLSQRYNSTSDF